MSKKKSPFAGKVRSNSEKKRSGKGYGHLNIPNGMKMYKEDTDIKTVCDFMPYIVEDPKHLDRDDKKEVALPGSQWYKRPYKLHRYIGVNKESIVCPTTFGLPCPLCEQKSLRMKEGETWEETKDLRPSDRNLYCIVPKGMSKWEEELHLWDISNHAYQKQLDNEIAENEQYEVFPDLEIGYTLLSRFSKEPSGDGSYPKVNRIDFESRKKGYPESTLEKVPCLDNVLTLLSYEQIEAKYYELAEREEEKDEKGDEPPDMHEQNPPDDIDEKPSEEKERKKKTNKPDPEPEKEKDPDTCVACEGSGKNTEGKTCRICRGTGKKRKPEPEKEPDKPERCPHGLVFGKNTDEADDCFNCTEWDDCIEEKGE